MTYLTVIVVMVGVYKTVRWLGAMWVTGAEAHDDTD